MQKTEIAIGLGSNLGDRSRSLREAVDRLSSEFLEDMVVSSVYESEPWGDTQQPKFLNMVVKGVSEWKPPAIINYLKSLERELGRIVRHRYGPREIDLDLLAFGRGVWKSEGVTVPHPAMWERSFVVLPLAEVWSDWEHPILKQRAGDAALDWLKNPPVSSIAIGPLPPNTVTL